MAPPRPGRWLAPLALAAAVIAVIVVVASSGGSSSGSTAPSAPSATLERTTTTHQTHHASSAAGGRTYVIQSGDTLAAVAQKNGVSLAQIEQINPGVNPSALHAGQRIRLPAPGG